MEFLAQFRQQMAAVWGHLGRTQKIVVVVAVVSLFLALGIWANLSGGEGSYTPLFTQLEPGDAGEVIEQLDKLKISYRLAEQGSAILVPVNDVYKTRLTLAREGLPKGSIVGFEIFDKTALGTTDFVRRIQYIRGLQGELARTIMQISGVEQASVHIVIPEPSLYTTRDNPPTAAVLLKLTAGNQLDRLQIRGIVHLISRSVEGLDPDNITMVDASGIILSSGLDSTPSGISGGSLSLTQLELQTSVQKDLERSVQTMLEQVLGPGNVVARVNAELDFDQKTVSRRYFEPIDGEGIVRTVKELRETFEGTGAETSGGTPGIPGYPATEGGGTKSTLTDTTHTYEINETSETLVIAPGSVKRLSVAVMVNRVQLTAQEQTVIEKAVAATIGLDNQRSDQITIAAFPFDTSLAQQLLESMEKQSTAQPGNQTIILVAAAFGAILLLFTVYRVMTGQRRRQNEEAALQEQLQASLAAQSEAASTRPESPDGRVRNEIERMVRQNPEEAARLVKAWLSEEDD